MVDVKNKRCEFNGCNKRPSYNFIDGTARGVTNCKYCNEHKEEGMINLKKKKTKQPIKHIDEEIKKGYTILPSMSPKERTIKKRQIQDDKNKRKLKNLKY